MDPDQTYAAVLDGNPEAAAALREWLDRGGFPPAVGRTEALAAIMGAEYGAQAAEALDLSAPTTDTLAAYAEGVHPDEDEPWPSPLSGEWADDLGLLGLAEALGLDPDDHLLVGAMADVFMDAMDAAYANLRADRAEQALDERRGAVSLAQ